MTGDRGTRSPVSLTGRMARRVAAHVSVGAVVVLLAACGTEDDSGSSGAGMDGMDMSQMDEPDATPADEVDGAVTTGSFTVLDTAPPGSDSVTGRAWLAQNVDGTTVTIRLEGLVPGESYVSHLHQQRCEVDNAGDHFKFDPDGSDVPPNEVHLGFVADEDGAGTATVTNDQEVGDGAPAIVVHPADAMDNKLACADFS